MLRRFNAGLARMRSEGLTGHWADTSCHAIFRPRDPQFEKVLHRLQHPAPATPQYSPHNNFPVFFGGKGTRQYATAPDNSTPLTSPTYKPGLIENWGNSIFLNRNNPHKLLRFIFFAPVFH